MRRATCVLLAALGCGGGGGGGGGGTIDAPAGADAAHDASAVFPAFRPAVPQIVPLATPAAVIAKPVIVPVYFEGDADRTELDRWFPGYIGSLNWHALTEYGVGSAAMGASVIVTDTAPKLASETDVGAFLAGKLDGTHPEFGATDETTLASEIFVVFYPDSTTLTFQGSAFCATRDSYHDDVAHESGANVQFVAVPRCDPQVDVLTIGASTGIVNAATNPTKAGAGTGWGALDAAHASFATYGTEVGTLCGEISLVDELISAETWSNASALTYADPCVPAHEPYFNSAPAGSDSIALAPGASTTVDVQLFSDAAPPFPWTVTAQSVTGATTVTLDKAMGKNGDILHMTVTAGGGAGSDVIAISSELQLFTTYWNVGVDVH